MKNVVLIGMALLLVFCGYFLKMKSDRVTALEGDARTREASLSELLERVKALEARPTAAPAPVVAAVAGNADHSAELASAEAALAAEMQRLQALKNSEASLIGERKNVGDPSLAGQIQNDQARIADLDRQIKTLDSSAKNQGSAYKSDEKAYRASVKEQEKSLGGRIKEAKAYVHSLDKQKNSIQKQKHLLDKPAQIQAIQGQIDQARANLNELESELAALKAKQSSDLSVNAYEQSQRNNYASDQRADLGRQRDQVSMDLANLKSRTDLSKRDTSDISQKVMALQAQEHESDAKILQLNQTIYRLKDQSQK